MRNDGAGLLRSRFNFFSFFMAATNHFSVASVTGGRWYLFVCPGKQRFQAARRCLGIGMMPDLQERSSQTNPDGVIMRFRLHRLHTGFSSVWENRCCARRATRSVLMLHPFFPVLWFWFRFAWRSARLLARSLARLLARSLARPVPFLPSRFRASFASPSSWL